MSGVSLQRRCGGGRGPSRRGAARAEAGLARPAGISVPVAVSRRTGRIRDRCRRAGGKPEGLAGMGACPANFPSCEARESGFVGRRPGDGGPKASGNLPACRRGDHPRHPVPDIILRRVGRLLPHGRTLGLKMRYAKIFTIFLSKSESHVALYEKNFYHRALASVL